MNTPAPFGTVLGYAPGGVPVYSSHYPSADSAAYPDRESFRSYHDGVFMGYKWQCVEFARRWLYLNRGWLFDDVAMAYDIFELRSGRAVRDNAPVALQSFANGGQRPPEPGSLLIWAEGGEFEDTGHVAIVTAVFEDRVRIAEQNLDHRLWPPGQDWGRELALLRTETGGYLVSCTFAQGSILGWVTATDDATHALPRQELSPDLLNLDLRELSEPPPEDWLDLSRPEQRAYAAAMGGARLSSDPWQQRLWFALSASAEAELKHATNELHAMFMHATHRVLQDDELLARFNLPRSIWPKLRASWNNRRNQMVTGRFDFSLSERGLKVYEYNADSASCYLETGLLQQRWFDAAGVTQGRDPGAALYADLVRAWRKNDVDSLLHILQDDDPEEDYHAAYMASAAEAAGYRTKRIRGMGGLRWDDSGHVVDSDGERVLWVWKTWAWETALDQLRAECDEDQALAAIGAARPRQGNLRLVDVLLRPEVMVFEPLWTLVPSNKAILPVLWQLFPQSPYLLETDYKLSTTLVAKGYVSKPIAGRCGFNISLVDPSRELTEETGGRFGEQEQVYQQLFPLPQLQQLYVQVGTFSVDGKYSAASVRVDRSPVITNASDLLPLRVVADEQWGAASAAAAASS
ncbi:bifunctional glutathionylspermidine amidase/synthase [Motiliproteus sediminis]|uniref:bifunctional glutathionylspermidine amidase/synthase n=1 Tax=Motiliproteus sediminis TaxID=1468178 RepID=UPI001AEFEBC3|nr:bifunctional glutathionylspermidine amidase/synthase [Motiliproteus sediminis]